MGVSQIDVDPIMTAAPGSPLATPGRLSLPRALTVKINNNAYRPTEKPGFLGKAKRAGGL